MPRVEIVEIAPILVPQVCAFLAREVGRGISAAEFSAAFERSWAPGPAGFALVAGDAVVGALATIRSERAIRGHQRAFCNLSCWGVAASFRSYAPALLQRAIAQRGVVYTNFTASSSVADVLRAFRFDAMPREERILLPFAPLPRPPAAWTTDVDAIESALGESGDDEAARHVHSHRGTRAKWVLVHHGRDACAFALHAMRVHAVPFAYVLYCSAPHLFTASLRTLRRACRRAWGWHAIAWPQARFGHERGTIAVTRPRPVLFRGDDVTPADLDGLYTELALLPILR
jgi:hypothetical protein